MVCPMLSSLKLTLQARVSCTPAISVVSAMIAARESPSTARIELTLPARPIRLADHFPMVMVWVRSAGSPPSTTLRTVVSTHSSHAWRRMARRSNTRDSLADLALTEGPVSLWMARIEPTSRARPIRLTRHFPMVTVSADSAGSPPSTILRTVVWTHLSRAWRPTAKLWNMPVTSVVSVTTEETASQWPAQIQRGGVDAFVAKINSAGSALIYAGFIGGSSDDRGNAIALTPGCAVNCEAFIAGETSSTQASFPVSVGPDLSQNGGVDAFVAKVNGDGSLGFAGYVGGSGDDRGKGIALDGIGAVYLTGETNSNQGNFPIKGELDRIQNLGFDVFVAKFCVTTCADVSVTKSDTPDPVTVGTNVTYTMTITNNGPDIATDVELTDTLPGAVALVSATPSAGSCTGTSIIVCDLGSLANGASATVIIVVGPTAIGTLTNTASVSMAETDTNPSNNVERAQTAVTLADLAVKAISTVTAAIPGSAIVVNDTTLNNGKVAAGASTTRFFLSTDSKFAAGDVSLGSRAIPALSPKQSSAGSTTVTIPLATALGRHFIVGVADADSGVAETKENNA